MKQIDDLAIRRSEQQHRIRSHQYGAEYELGRATLWLDEALAACRERDEEIARLRANVRYLIDHCRSFDADAMGTIMAISAALAEEEPQNADTSTQVSTVRDEEEHR